jgi:23S rRNA pseudouridine2457 synthase
VILLFNKPFRVLSQFSRQGDKRTLADFIDVRHVYPAGRLDYDSEGLLVLTDDGALQQRIAHPRFGKDKEYWVQVEGVPRECDLEHLRHGVRLKDGRTRRARVRRMGEPPVCERVPPIRERRRIPTAWLSLTLSEGRNRQVRRMTAHIGYPTLRLIRYRVGDWTLEGIPVGEYRLL